MPALLDFHDHLDLDYGAAGERRHAEGGASVFAAVAEDRDEQVGATVHDGGLRREVGGAVDEAGDLHDALHLRQVADFFFQRGEQSEGGGAGGGVGGLFVGVLADLAGDDFTGGVVRQVAGEEDEITGAHGGHVVGDGRIRHGQGETEGGEFRLGRGGRFGGAERRERDEGEAQGGDEETAHGGDTLNL